MGNANLWGMILMVAGLLLACGPSDDPQVRVDNMYASNVERHRELIAQRVQYAHNHTCLRLIDDYQTEYDAVMNRPLILDGEGEEAVLQFWLNTFYEAAKVIDAHEPDINHHCQ